MDNSFFELSGLDDIEFFWGNPQLKVDAVFRPGIGTPFSPTAFEDLEMGGSGENRIRQ